MSKKVPNHAPILREPACNQSLLEASVSEIAIVEGMDAPSTLPGPMAPKKGPMVKPARMPKQSGPVVPNSAPHAPIAAGASQESPKSPKSPKSPPSPLVQDLLPSTMSVKARNHAPIVREPACSQSLPEASVPEIAIVKGMDAPGTLPGPMAPKKGPMVKPARMPKQSGPVVPNLAPHAPIAAGASQESPKSPKSPPSPLVQDLLPSTMSYEARVRAQIVRGRPLPSQVQRLDALPPSPSLEDIVWWFDPVSPAEDAPPSHPIPDDARVVTASEAILMSQVLGVSPEMENKFPLGFSLLLLRVFLSPQSLQKEVETLTVPHLVEYWRLSRQLVDHWAVANVEQFVSSTLTLKSQIEIVNAYVDLVIRHENDLVPSTVVPNSSKPAADDILRILAMSLPASFDIETVQDDVKRLWQHSLSRFDEFLAWTIPTHPMRGSTRKDDVHEVPDLRLGTYKTLTTAFERFPTDATLYAMGQSFSCHTGLLSIIWPSFHQFLSCLASSPSNSELPQSQSLHLSLSSDSIAKASLKGGETQNKQNDASSIALDFGDRLVPEALKSLLEFFKTGVTTVFTDYLSARSILEHAEELHFVNGNGKALPAFSDLVDHLKTIQPYQGIMPANNCFYALAFAIQTKDKKIWDETLQTIRSNSYHAHCGSESAKWFHQTHPDAHWLATWALFSGKKRYPFSVD